MTAIPLTADELLNSLGRGEDVPVGVIADAFRDAGMEKQATEVERWRIISRSQFAQEFPQAARFANSQYWSQRLKTGDGWQEWQGKDSVGDTIEDARRQFATELRRHL